MPLRNRNALDFVRQILQPRVTRPQMAMAIYPDGQSDTGIEFLITTTAISLRFGTDDTTIQYIGKSVIDLAAAINRSSIPVRAVALSRGIVLKTGELIGSTTYRVVPVDFPVYDRVTDGGAVIRMTRYTVKYDRLSNVKLLPPYNDAIGLPWHAVVSNGAFTQEFRGRRYHFEIPEYGDQVWSLAYGRPFKDMVSASVTVKSTGVIQLPRYPIHWTENNLIFSSNGSPLSTSIIEDVDVYNGLVYLKQGFDADSNLRVDYVYLETNYIYPHVNLNAHFSQNPDLIDKFIVIYMLPSESLVSSRTNRTVFHAIGDSLFGTIDSIETIDIDMPIAIIGAYSVQQIIATDRATLLDTRIKGGGLRSDKGLKSPIYAIEDVGNTTLPKTVEVKIEDVYKDSASFYDIGKYDGEPYPGAAAVVVEVPDHMRSKLPEKDVRDKATKFLAAGIYPVFEFSTASGEYSADFSQDISSTANLHLNESFGNKTGSFWLPSDVTIPSGSVLTSWAVDYQPNITVESKDLTNILHVPQGSGYYQPYVKSSPDAIITWKERVLVQPSGQQVTTPLYTSWEEKRVVDTREVGDGQLMKGYLVADAQYEDKEYKDFHIFSPYRVDNTGDLLLEMARECTRIQHINELTYGTGTSVGTHQVTTSIGDVEDRSLVGIGSYGGLHPRHEGSIRLAGSTKTHPSFNTIARAIGSGVPEATQPTIGFVSYDVDAQDYDLGAPSSFSLGTQLTMLTDYMRYSLDHLGSGSFEYTAAISGYGNVLIALSGAPSQLPVTSPWWIEPDYVFDGGLNAVPLAIETGFVNIATTGEDHRMAEALPGLIGLWSAVPSYESGAFNNAPAMQALSNIMHNEVPGFVRDSFSGIVNNHLPFLITGHPNNGAGNLAATGWYTRHDRYGQFAGTLARDGMLIYEHLMSGKARVGVLGTQRGATASALTEHSEDVESILDTVFTGFDESLHKGGILDAHTPRLLEAYALAVHYGQVNFGEGNTDFVSNINKYSGLYQTGVKIMLRSMLTQEGDIQEITCVNQEYGPVQGTPPVDMIGALSAGALWDKDYLAPLQGVIKTLTGTYSYSGAYSADANLVSLSGGHEIPIINALSTAFTRLNGQFDDIDMLSLYRSTSLD